MKKFNLLDVAAIVIWLIPVAYLWYVYPTLPATVPMHFDMAGKPNGYGSKSQFLTFQYILIGLPVLVYLLLKFLPAIDPKKNVKVGEATFQKLALGIVLFFSALNILIVYATRGGVFQVGKIMLPLVGLFFAYIGNLLHNIKPNYFAGVRTPWTLEDPDNWRATHRLASKLWFIGGIVLAAIVLFLPATAGVITFFCLLMVMVFIPVIYSFVYYKNHQAK
jgi:uncharacterized membrane protein